ncbi:MFS transporter [Arenibaculum pallidiluteum]|uniref:MFS transporter n=1 Tax=Arenibaculum pallidiluteum TaxID=2812559 RepID=UPI001A965093|nr:MFS transporter [Arenibaculum pallidiluteum]
MSECTATAECAADVSERETAAWPAVVSLSLGVFALVTAEFLPASLLTPMASDLSISDGLAGQAVTATAVVGAIAGPAVVIGTSRFDRRWILLGLTALLIISNALAAAAPNLPVLLFSRILLGISLGGFWAMSAALAMRLVPPELMPRAMAIVLTGVSLATVCAAPVGAWIGDRWGWRAAFIIADAVALAALLAQFVTVPPLPSRDRATLGTFGLLLRRPRVRIGLAIVALVVSAHFAAFTYVRPFLEQVPRMGVDMISLVLLAYGVGGFFGNFAGGFLAERSERVAVAFASGAIAATALALVLLGISTGVSGAATALWGFAFGALPVGAQTWITRAAPDHAESAGGLLLTAFQVAIASGAVFGGLLVDGFGPRGPIGYCAAAAALACLCAAAQTRRPALA